jgi:hypothetical protein
MTAYGRPCCGRPCVVYGGVACGSCGLDGSISAALAARFQFFLFTPLQPMAPESAGSGYLIKSVGPYWMKYAAYVISNSKWTYLLVEDRITNPKRFKDYTTVCSMISKIRLAKEMVRNNDIISSQGDQN